MKWKVCGMKYQDNIHEVLKLQPDYMGFIFYRKSPRYVGDKWEGPGAEFPATTQKVGVFVNEPIDKVVEKAERFGLDLLQLHGNESPEYCRELAGLGYSLIKAIAVAQGGDLDQGTGYLPWVQYFLLDTKSQAFGGTGQTFDWEILKDYPFELPMILSGGISLENVQRLRNLSDLNLAFIDVNSRFESAPGRKIHSRLSMLKQKLSEL